MNNKNKALKYFKWFEGRVYPEIKLKLRAGGKIDNVSTFINSHLPIVKANYKNKTFLPYVKRLDEVRKAIEKLELK